MIVHFEAESIEIEELDTEVLVVGFYTEENYLMIQRSLSGDDSGMNAYHIERDDQSFGGYGGVQKISLHRDSLEAELDETGKENLQCDAVRVEFQTVPETFQLLTDKLAFIFGDRLVVFQ